MLNIATYTISVITVCYNAEKYIEKTILNVLSQDYPSVEYILIDGQSKDRTWDIVEKYKDQIAVRISEKDQGIYDAMNKGLQHAKGDYIVFINAGDGFYAKDTLSTIFKDFSHADVYYGDTMLVNENGDEIGLRSVKTTRKLPKKLIWKSLQWGMVVCHQSFIAKRTLSPHYENTKHPYSADIDWMIKVLKEAKTVEKVAVPIAYFLEGGFSKEKRWASWKDRFEILRAHYGIINTVWYHGIFVLRAVWYKITG